jgi:ElaB/YqjD/DUF883 family membrane-anchored ribosome-binding protein
MSNQYPGRQSENRLRTDGAQNRGGQPHKQGQVDERSQTSEGLQSTLQSTTSTAKRAASEAAFTISGHVKDLLDTQLASGAVVVGQLGKSAQRAAEDLEQDTPQLAGLVRGVADRIEDYADHLREQSVDALLQSASSFTRRQPALVFGLAALAGFFALRTIKSTAAPSRPARAPRSPSTGDYHGT